MKNLFLLMFLSSGHTLLFGQATSIKGYIKAFTPDRIYLNIHNGDRILKDSAEVRNGSFEFTVDVSATLAARLVTRDFEKKIPDKENNFVFPALQLLFFIEPGKNIFINGDYAEWPIAQISGGKNNDLQSEYLIHNKFDLLRERAAMASAIKAKNQGDSIGFVNNEILRNKLQELNEATLNNLIERNPNSILTAFHIYEQLPFVEDERPLEKIFRRFKTEIRQSVYGIAIQEKLLELKSSAIGTIVKNFSVMGKDSLISIESFRGKFVLLDFWGSWCKPCREANPHLKKLYAEYKEKGFEIIGIAHEKGDRSKEQWLKAINQDGISWINILNNEAMEKNQTNLIELFSIDSYPTKILIDREGRIVLKTGNDMSQLEESLRKNLDMKN